MRASSKPNTLIISIVSIVLALSICYMYACLSPIKVTKATLTDGDRTIVFQGMTHVGKKTFYNQVRRELMQYKSKEYSWLYEGIEISSNNKGNLTASSTCPLLKNKNYSLQPSYSEHININTDQNIDKNFNVSTIEDSYLTTTIPDYCNNMSIVDVRLAYRLKLLKDAFGFNNKPNIQNSIIDGRNKMLASSAIKTKGDLIIHFGDLHLEGFIEEIKELNPNIKVSSMTRYTSF